MHPIQLYSVPCPDEPAAERAELALKAEDRFRAPTVFRPGKLYYSLDMGGLDDADAQLEAHRVKQALVLAMRRGA